MLSMSTAVVRQPIRRQRRCSCFRLSYMAPLIRPRFQTASTSSNPPMPDPKHPGVGHDPELDPPPTLPPVEPPAHSPTTPTPHEPPPSPIPPDPRVDRGA